MVKINLTGHGMNINPSEVHSWPSVSLTSRNGLAAGRTLVATTVHLSSQ